MREHKEHNEYKEPSTKETILGFLLLCILAIAIWFFVDGPKNFRVNTVFELDHFDSMEEPPEG